MHINSTIHSTKIWLFSTTYPKRYRAKNFPDLHFHIMKIKGWLRGIHQHCSEERLQGYLDKFHFRHNRRSNMETIFDVLIRKMVFAKPVRL